MDSKRNEVEPKGPNPIPPVAYVQNVQPHRDIGPCNDGNNVPNRMDVKQVERPKK